jgi:hypothetical protein
MPFHSKQGRRVSTQWKSGKAMHTIIKIDGNRRIRITLSTIAEALASTPMKVRSVIRKRIRAMGASLI